MLQGKLLSLPSNFFFVMIPLQYFYQRNSLVSQLIYAASRRQVSDVWVAGKRLLDHGELTTIDLDSVINSARKWQSRLAGLEDAMIGKVKEPML